jgi:uncharacterized protein YggE
MIRRIALLALLVAAPLSAQQAAPGEPQIVASGRGDAAAAPDEAQVTVAVVTRAPTAVAAGAANASRLTAVLNALVRVGIPRGSITTQSFAVSPNVEYDGGTTRQAGYVATNSVHVRTSMLGQVGQIIDAALAAGADRVNAVTFTSSRAAELRRASLAQAVADARADAEAMAAAAGGRLGSLIELTSTSGGGGYALEQSRIMIRGANSGSVTPVNATDVQVGATVVGRWRFVGP